MKSKILLVLSTWLLCCCSGNRIFPSTGNISVSTPTDSIDINPIIEEYRIVPILSDSLIIGNLISVCQRDSLLYSLDEYGTMSITSLISEETVYSRNLLGEGPGECICPQSLTVDSNNIYIYDLGNMCISCYSVDSLSFKKQIPIDIPSMSIATYSDKIAVSNIDFRQGCAQIIEFDLEGNKTKEYDPMQENIDISYALSPPLVYAYEDAFCYVSFWRNIFNEIDPSTGDIAFSLISFKGFPDVYTLDAVKVYNQSTTNHLPIVLNVFKNNNYMVIKYLYKDRVYYCFQKDGEEVMNGSIALSNGKLFCPRWQSDEYLIGTTLDFDTDSDSAPTCVILTKFKE